MSSPPPPPVASSGRKTLTKADGPLVWIDCEMTGLELGKDRIIEVSSKPSLVQLRVSSDARAHLCPALIGLDRQIAVIITDGDLVPLDEGIEFVIQTPKEVLDQMGEWCTDMHGKVSPNTSPSRRPARAFALADASLLST